MRIRKSDLIKLSIILLVFRIFFSTVGYLSFGYPFIEMAIFALFLLGARIDKHQLIISIKERIFWLIFIFFIFATSLFSTEIIGTMKFSFLYFFIVFSAIILDSTRGWQKTYIKSTLYLSFLFCITVYLSYLFKFKFLDLIGFLYPPHQLSKINILYSYDYFSGISNQVGFVGFFISIGILILFTKYINDKNKRTLFNILFMIGGLILTAKRGFVVAIIISLIIIQILSARKKHKSIVINITIMSVIAGIIGFSMYSFFEPTRHLVNRFFLDSNISSNRFDIYVLLLEQFKEKPLFGNGFNSFGRYMGTNFGSVIDGHNIYLQLLAETGIVGTIIVILAFAKGILGGIKRYFSNSNNQVDVYILISIGVQVFFLLYGLAGNPIYDYQFLMMYFYIIAFSINPLVDDKQKEINNTIIKGKKHK